MSGQTYTLRVTAAQAKLIMRALVMLEAFEDEDADGHGKGYRQDVLDRTCAAVAAITATPDTEP